LLKGFGVRAWMWSTCDVGKKKILVTVKAYPEKSIKHHTVVCTAGITEDDEWIRLYPIQVDAFMGRNKIKKYDWIEVECQKATNEYLKRKESYKVRDGSIKILESLSTNKGKTPWEERNKIILPHIAHSIEHYRNSITKTGHLLD